MPKYTYYCADCKQEFDISLPLGEDAKDCPNCNSINIVKQIPEFSVKIVKNEGAGKVVKRFIDQNREEKKKILEEFKNIEKEY